MTSAQAQEPQSSEPAPAPVTGPAAVTVYEELLRKAKSFGPFRCDVVMSSLLPGEEGAVRTYTMWRKGLKYRIEGTNADGVYERKIVHPDAIYEYDPANDTYTKQPATYYRAEDVEFAEMAEWARARELGTFTVVTDEPLGDTVTTVFGIRDPYLGETTMKLWLQRETGHLIRQEHLPWMALEWKNFLFKPIPDSLFDVPPENVVEAPSPDVE